MSDVETEPSYIPALGFASLTRIYDPVVALTVRERRFKQKLIAQAGLRDRLDLLDLACGTGTLAVRAKQVAPQVKVTGIDADTEILERARQKAGEAAVEIQFDQGFSTSLPYGKSSFDRVLSSLFFHHLAEEDKVATLREVMRVLRRGGELHVADWGKPSGPLMAALSLSIRTLDGFEPTRANLEGRLPDLFATAGLEQIEIGESLRTIYGTLTLYSAVKP
jgi:ubiquinone/menaquinone biosynthesis C-methylase UbiE